ncbi:MAG: ATP-binding protein [Candidatus Paracaedibacteraceae bacterium]|nr:ATP-binding protein [Candidatus Paracaedibacteraceae bacterium]
MITQNVARQIEDINKSRQKIEERINLRHSFLESHLKTLSSINVARYRMDTKQLFDSFEQVQSIWQELVKRSFSSISSQFLQDDLPNIKSQLLLLNSNNPETIALSKRIDRFDFWLDSQLELDQNLYNRVLLLSGKVRSKLYQELTQRNVYPIRKYSKKYFLNVSDEIRVIPTRWAATIVSKVYDWKRNIAQGWRGMKSIFSEAGVLALILYMIFFTYRRFERLSELLENWVSKQTDAWGMKSRYVRFTLYLVYRSIPWFLVITAGYISKKLIKFTTVDELSELIDLVIYYFYYRWFLALVTYGSTRLRVDNIISFSYEFYKKLLNSIKHLSLTFLIYFMVLKAIDSVVGKALVYELSETLFILIITVLLVWEIYLWRESIASAYDKLVSQSMVFKKLSWNNQFAIYFLPYLQLVLLCCGLGLSLFARLASGTKVGARLSSQIFVHRAKMVARLSQDQEGQERLSDDVLQNILEPGTERLFAVDTPEIDTIYGRILAWDRGEEALSSVCLTGERGAGATTVIDEIVRRCTHLRQVVVNVREKYVNMDDLLKDITVADYDKGQTLREIFKSPDTAIEKTILVIDNLHNMFLSYPGGFKLLEEILSFASKKHDRVFLMLTCNSRSFDYIRKISSKAPVGDAVIEIQSWDINYIKRIIQFRAERSQVEYSFEDLGLALGVDNDLSVVENRYYQALALKSHGIPRLALLYWAKSLYRVSGDTIYMVGLPDDISQDDIRRLTYIHWSLLSWIMRHQKMSLNSLCQLGMWPESDVRYYLYDLFKRGFIEEMEYHFFQIESTFYWDCLSTLRRLNLIND